MIEPTLNEPVLDSTKHLIVDKLMNYDLSRINKSKKHQSDDLKSSTKEKINKYDEILYTWTKPAF